MKKAVYPGSFDPITLGHIDLIERAAKFVDELTVLVSVSSQKQALFSPEERVVLIEKSLSHLNNIKVAAYQGLTTDYMKDQGIRFLIRGLRQVEDFEYEKNMAQYNWQLQNESETILLYANPSLSYISSRGVKEVARHTRSENDIAKFVPKPVISVLIQKMKG